MNTFDRHLVREWLQVLGLWLAATCGLLFFQISFSDFRTLREDGARVRDLLLYFLVTMPSFLAIVLPSALLLSLLFTLAKMHRANELTAMRAAGVGFMRMMRPVWVLGVLACGVAWWLNSVVVPWSVERSDAEKNYLAYRAEAREFSPDRVGAVYGVAFDDRQGGRMWFFDRYSDYTHLGYGVSVSQLDPHRRELSRLVASRARFDAVRREWTFMAGREILFDPDTGEQMTSTPFAQKIEPGYHEDPRLMQLTTARPVDLSFFELARLMKYYAIVNKSKAVPYAVRYYGLIADTAAPLISIAIAIPFAVVGVRVNPVVGVSKAIGLFFLYYVVMNIASILATKHAIDPQLAAWLPNLGMAGLAAWLFARLR